MGIRNPRPPPARAAGSNRPRPPAARQGNNGLPRRFAPRNDRGYGLPRRSGACPPSCQPLLAPVGRDKRDTLAHRRPSRLSLPLVVTGGGLPRNQLASSATGSASLISSIPPRFICHRQRFGEIPAMTDVLPHLVMKTHPVIPRPARRLVVGIRNPPAARPSGEVRIAPQGYLPPQPLMLRGRRLAPRPRWGLAMTDVLPHLVMKTHPVIPRPARRLVVGIRHPRLPARRRENGLPRRCAPRNDRGNGLPRRSGALPAMTETKRFVSRQSETSPQAGRGNP